MTRANTSLPPSEQANAAPQWLNSREQQVWRAWLNTHIQINAELAQQLSADTSLSLSDYEVLVHLSESPDNQQRIVALANTMQWSRSRLSHQITRMAKRGLVRRETCDADGRGAFVVLEPAGLEAITNAAPGHVKKVRELIFDHLSDAEVEKLLAILSKLDAQF
ncbi:MarR family winged helix-turn-helix transcriptional regulator [Corynebacterium macclintockiae]|uniref:MarR family winged helix-turn-helix transcriptional regulator n=1 Tax=Corynebacterium macclintockiae TaxID=2913501 RepID=UPI00055888FF|nr:MarR family winged helix-turn-helix transcriptional regulator [Corynebacterium macclintockiae]MDK8869971.1 MarR family winged helix-turn-helix transcriptional regulator [Corynebacterium macclintockiae]